MFPPNFQVQRIVRVTEVLDRAPFEQLLALRFRARTALSHNKEKQTDR